MIDHAGIAARLRALEPSGAGEYSAAAAALEGLAADQEAITEKLRMVAGHLASEPSSAARHRQLASDIRLLIAG